MLDLLKKQNAIGLHISDNFIKVLLLGSNNEILSYGNYFLEQGVVQTGRIINKEVFKERLKWVFLNSAPYKIDFNRKIKAVISLPESKTLFHIFNLKNSYQHKELRSIVFEEAEKLVPINHDKLYWDYLAYEKNSGGLQKVLYAASFRDIVDEYMAVLAELNIEAVVFELEMISLARALLAKKESLPYTAIINMDFSETSMGIIDPNRVLGTSNVVSGGLSLFFPSFGAITKNSAISSFSEPEKKLENMIVEIKKLILSYEEKYGVKVENIILSGGFNVFSDVKEIFNEVFLRNIEIGALFSNIEGGILPSGDEYGLLFSDNVMGLAMRGSAGIDQGLNIIRHREQAQDAKTKAPPDQQMPRKEIIPNKVAETKKIINKKYISLKNKNMQNTNPIEFQEEAPIKNTKRNIIIIALLLVAALAFLGVVIYRSFYSKPDNLSVVNTEEQFQNEIKNEEPIKEENPPVNEDVKEPDKVVLATAGERDDKRISDMVAISEALRLYAGENDGHYPIFSSWLVPKYLLVLPQDPSNDMPYVYSYYPPEKPTKYHIGASLEERNRPELQSDSDLNAPNSPFGFDGNDDKKCTPADFGSYCYDMIQPDIVNQINEPALEFGNNDTPQNAAYSFADLLISDDINAALKLVAVGSQDKASRILSSMSKDERIFVGHAILDGLDLPDVSDGQDMVSGYIVVKDENNEIERTPFVLIMMDDGRWYVRTF